MLARLVARYSPSGRERGAVREFRRIARDLGFATSVDRAGNGFARRGRGRPRLWFLGHIDTVEGRRPVRRRGGRVYGRGSVDAKGALAAALWAGRGFEGPGEVTIVAAVGEEADSRGARHLLGRRAPDRVIVGEPSGWDGVTIGYKGELQVVATFRGRRTHYSSPTPTTTDVALDWTAAVRGLALARHTESLFASLTAKTVAVESRRAGDSETTRVTVDFRLPPGVSTEEVLGMLPSDPGHPRLSVRIRAEPIEVSRVNPTVLALSEGIRALGTRPTLWRKSGTSDLNVVVPVWAVPAAAYGPGDAKLDHTARESLSVAELERSATVLRTAFERLAHEGRGLGRTRGNPRRSARASRRARGAGPRRPIPRGSGADA
ncbi:MAG TPA: M20/M25/M40 family metallo-hydrolase [Thermoplasmata archaeon]|nr:M20/M25/M40 family metallo-hydrolase [Thermoplasmata archaeon]